MAKTSAKKSVKKTGKKTAAKKAVAKGSVTKKTVQGAAPKKTGRKTTVKVAKKAAVKKTVRKTPVKSAAKAAPVKKAGAAIRNPYTKAQLMNAIAETTGIAKKDVVAVMAELSSIVERHVKKRSAGQFSLPGLLKIRTVKKKATKARKGRNPFTGEEIMIKPKPAHTVVRVTPLRALKTMAE